MEPTVHYAKTRDGVSIAYTILGRGDETLVCAPSIWGDLHMYRSVPLMRAWYDGLAERGRRVVLYDSRNMGCSEHRDLDYSVAARLADLDAVVDSVGLEVFYLYGFFSGCQTAALYAAARPERVQRLVLLDAFACGGDYYSTVPEIAIVERLGVGKPEEDRLVRLSIANIITGFADQAFATEIADAMSTSMSIEEQMAFSKEARATDISDTLARLTVPTLVLFSARFLPGVRPLTRQVAQLVPGAEFVEVGPPAARELDIDALEAVDAFLRGCERAAPRGAEKSETRSALSGKRPIDTGVTVILFADIADSTALTEQMGDARFRAEARELDARLRSIISDHSGTPIEGRLLGDGVLATFASASRAVAAALECTQAGNDGGLPLHLGLHAGDVIREAGDVFGGAVNIAARVSGESRPGEILVSQTVRDLARTSAGVSFEDDGAHTVKGVGEPLRLWRVVHR
jgi:class 3 adenylate cyclase/pimeloyl-ACP methyl ester carboxylesterase